MPAGRGTGRPGAHPARGAPRAPTRAGVRRAPTGVESLFASLGALCVAWTLRELACLLRSARRPGLLVFVAPVRSAEAAREASVSGARGAAEMGPPPRFLPAATSAAPPPVG